MGYQAWIMLSLILHYDDAHIHIGSSHVNCMKTDALFSKDTPK